jgi:DNA-binding NarL/FixJ family response regulator
VSISRPTKSGERKWRILIVDDHPIVRRGLADVLSREPDMEGSGGAVNVSEALKALQESSPDLVVVDITLEDSSGLELIAEIKNRWSDVKTVVWSMFDEKIFAQRAIRAGAMGYVNKKEPIERLVAAIRQVLGGNFCLSPGMTNWLIRRAAGATPLEEDPMGRLSNRELEVFAMLGQGMTTREIARKLGISPKTVETHRENIKTKLDLKNSCELSRRAVLWALENT